MSNDIVTVEERVGFLRDNFDQFVDYASQMEQFIPKLCVVFEEYKQNTFKYGIVDEDLVNVEQFINEQLLPLIEKAQEIAEKASQNG